MVLGSTGSGLKLRSFSSFVPWKSPQSTSSFLLVPEGPAASTRYFDPVTHPAAPRKVSFAIALPFYRFPAAVPLASYGSRAQRSRSFANKESPNLVRQVDGF